MGHKPPLALSLFKGFWKNPKRIITHFLYHVQTISDLFGIDLANEFVRIKGGYLGEKQIFLHNPNSPPYYDFVETFLGEPEMKKFTCIWASGEVVERAFYELYCLINHHE